MSVTNERLRKLASRSQQEEHPQAGLEELDRNQAEYDKGYKAGEQSALNRVKRDILEKAADKWKRGQDSEATMLRDLANNLTLSP